MFLCQTNFVLFNCLFFFLFYILIDKAQQKSNAFTQPFTAAGNPTGPPNKKPVNDRKYVFLFRPKPNIWPEKHLALD